MNSAKILIGGIILAALFYSADRHLLSATWAIFLGYAAGSIVGGLFEQKVSG